MYIKYNSTPLSLTGNASSALVVAVLVSAGSDVSTNKEHFNVGSFDDECNQKDEASGSDTTDGVDSKLLITCNLGLHCMGLTLPCKSELGEWEYVKIKQSIELYASVSSGHRCASILALATKCVVLLSYISPPT